MRWNCPHCGIKLAIQDEKLSSGWSFSRCYKCGGFGLVRRSEVNLIKVDKAPVGEQILLPEATEEPLINLSNTATKRLAEVTSSPTPPQKLPEPLPEQAYRPIHHRLLPVAIGMTGAIAIGSGVYLYIQGQALLEKAQVTATSVSRSAAVDVAVQPGSSEILRAPLLTEERQLVRNARPDLSDEVRHKAMAPERQIEVDSEELAETNDDQAKTSQQLVIRVSVANAKLRSGPGTEFPVVGIADPGSSYSVTGWHERWFRITSNGKPGWIRNDLVRLTDRSATRQSI